MKKNFKIENLDCANCAEKMQKKIAKIDGVRDASISFMTSSLMLEYDEDKFEQIKEEALKAVKKVERECKIVF